VSVHYIKNALALAGFIIFVYILLMFYRGNKLHENIQGTWVNIECFSIKYTFTDNQYYINGLFVGTFRIRGNHITFNCGNSYHIRVRPQHNNIILHGIQYLRR